MTLTLSISAGLPVFYQVAWGDGTVTKLQENGTILKGQCHEKKIMAFYHMGSGFKPNERKFSIKKCTYTLYSTRTQYTVHSIQYSIHKIQLKLKTSLLQWLTPRHRPSPMPTLRSTNSQVKHEDFCLCKHLYLIFFFINVHRRRLIFVSKCAMNVPGKSKANVQKRFFKLRIMSLKFKNVQEKFFLFEIQNLLYSTVYSV